MEGEKQTAPDATLAALRAQAHDLIATAQPEKHEWLFNRVGISTDKRLECVRSALDALEANNSQLPPGAQRVPRVIHRLWLTNSDKPRLPPETYLSRIKEQARRLADFEIVFWVNCEAVARHVAQVLDTITSVRQTAPRIVSIDTLNNEPIYARVASAVAERKFVLAGDILKHFLIARFGGIYADLGVDFGAELAQAAINRDVSLFLANELFFQPAFMAAPPGSPPFQLFHKLMLCPEILAACCVAETEKLTAGSEIWVHGGIGFTICYLLFDDGTLRLLPVAPNRGLLHVESLGSWYRQTDNYGGVSLSEAPLTHIDPLKVESVRQRSSALRAESPHLSKAECIRRVISSELDRAFPA